MPHLPPQVGIRLCAKARARDARSTAARRGVLRRRCRRYRADCATRAGRSRLREGASNHVQCVAGVDSPRRAARRCPSYLSRFEAWVLEKMIKQSIRIIINCTAQPVSSKSRFRDHLKYTWSPPLEAAAASRPWSRHHYIDLKKKRTPIPSRSISSGLACLGILSGARPRAHAPRARRSHRDAAEFGLLLLLLLLPPHRLHWA